MEHTPWHINWSDEIKTGIPEIDNDHVFLISIINRFNDSVIDRKPITEIKKNLQELIEFIEIHSESEEEVLKQIGYPEVNKIRKAHMGLNETIQRIMQDVQQNSTEYELIEAGLKVKQAKIKHVLNEDKLFATYLRMLGGDKLAD